MSYNKVQIKNGINLHLIKNDFFKTNLIAVFLTNPLKKESVTKNALISLLLKRGSNNIKSQEEISRKLEEMYGATFNCGLDKVGDNQVLKFYIESVNKSYLPNNEDLLKESINILFDIVFNPLQEGNAFKEEYFETEKQILTELINGRINNKGLYAYNRCIEEMYKNEPYGLYKFGYVNDIAKIKNEELYNQYKCLINSCKIDIFVSGNLSDNISQLVSSNLNIINLNDRIEKYSIDIPKDKNDIEEVKQIEEKMDVAQGKITIGLDILINDENTRYESLVYNAILGGTANSKLFQNVREKAGLAYYATSNYVKAKNNIFIRSGIEIENFEKAVEIIKKQLKQMEDGEFSKEDMENAKRTIISTIKGIKDEQSTEIAYYFGQEISKHNISIEEYEQKIRNVQKEDIINIAKNTKLNTIYFLRN